MELTCQTRKCALTFRVLAVTGRACRNIVAGNAFLVAFFARSGEFGWSAAQRPWIEVLKIRGQCRYHRRAQHMRHVEHDGVRSPAHDEGSQLILKIFGLLSGESGHRIRSTKTLA